MVDDNKKLDIAQGVRFLSHHASQGVAATAAAAAPSGMRTSSYSINDRLLSSCGCVDGGV